MPDSVGAVAPSMAASVRVRRATTADAAAIAQIIGHPQVAPHTLQLLNCTRHLDEAERDDAHSLSGG